MTIWEIFLIGLGLSMDAAAVSMTNSMVYSGQRKRLILMPLFFGGFQLLLTLGGYFAGNLFSGLVEKYSGIISFVILAYIGGKMIYDGIKHDDCKCEGTLSLYILTAQAFATAIDAFAMGVSFGMMGGRFEMNIFAASALIGIITFCCSLVAMIIGKKLGDAAGCKAEIFGGVVLVAIGIKSLLGL